MSLRRRATRLATIAIAIGAIGCQATFTQPRAAGERSRQRWSHFFLWGVVGHTEVDVRDFCASGRAAEVRTAADPLTVGVTLLTAGIYTPRKVRVTCAPPTPGPEERTR